MTPAKNTATYTVEQPIVAGGMNSAADPRTLGDSTCRELRNAVPGRSGRAVKRPGFTNLLASAEAAPLRLCRRLKTEDGSFDKWIVAAGSRLVAIDDAGTVTVLKTDLATATRLAAAIWDNNLHISDGVTGLWAYGIIQNAAAVKAMCTVNPAGTGNNIYGTAVSGGVAGNAITIVLNAPATSGAALAVSLSGQAITVNLAGYPGVAATAATWSGATQELRGTATTAGTAGNSIRIRAVDGGAASTSIGVSGSDVTITLGTSAVNRTYAAVVAALAASGPATALASWATTTSDPSVYAVSPFAYESFSGGAAGTTASTDPYSTNGQVTAALNANAGIAALCTWTAEGTGNTIMVPTVTTAFSGGAAAATLGLRKESVRNFSYLAARQASERLFGIDANDSTTVRWCERYDAQNWPEANMLSPGGVFRSLLECGDTFLLTQRDCLYRIDGSDPATWQMRPIASQGLGVAEGAEDTTLLLEGVATWLSPRGIVSFDGARPRVVSPFVAPSLPNSAATWNGAFSMVLPAPDNDARLLATFFKSATAISGCDRAMIYDYEAQAWGGPWTFASGAPTCGDWVEGATGTSGKPVLGTYEGQLMRASTGFADNGAPFEMRAILRSWDCDTARMDKQIVKAWTSLKTSGVANVLLELFIEDEATVRTIGTRACSRTFTTPSGVSEDMYEMRLQMPRAKWFHLEVSNSEDVGVETSFAGAEFFFDQDR